MGTDQPMFICPKCGSKSLHPKDVSERYCGNCHEFNPRADDSVACILTTVDHLNKQSARILELEAQVEEKSKHLRQLSEIAQSTASERDRLAKTLEQKRAAFWLWQRIEEGPPDLHEIGGCAEEGETASDFLLIFDRYADEITVAKMHPDMTWTDIAGRRAFGVTHYMTLPKTPQAIP